MTTKIPLARAALERGDVKQATAYIRSAKAALVADGNSAEGVWDAHSRWLLETAESCSDSELSSLAAYVAFTSFCAAPRSMENIEHLIECSFLFHAADRLVGSDIVSVSLQFMKILSILVNITPLMFYIDYDEGTTLGAKVAAIVSMAAPLVAAPERAMQFSFGLNVLGMLILRADDLALAVDAAFMALRACARYPVEYRALVRNSTCTFLDAFSKPTRRVGRVQGGIQHAACDLRVCRQRGGRYEPRHSARCG